MRRSKLQPNAGPAASDAKPKSWPATNHVDQAIRTFARSAESAPGNEHLLNRLVRFYLVAKSRAKRSTTASSVHFEKDPDNFAAIRFRADAYLNIGKHAEAIADFDKALALKERRREPAEQFCLGVGHIAGRKAPRWRTCSEDGDQSRRSERNTKHLTF